MKKFTVDDYSAYANSAVAGIAYKDAPVYNVERENTKRICTSKDFAALAALSTWYTLPGNAIMEYGKRGRVLLFGNRAKEYAITHLSRNTESGALGTVDVKNTKIGVYVYVDPAMIEKIDKFEIGAESPKLVPIRVTIKGHSYYASVPFEYFDAE